MMFYRLEVGMNMWSNKVTSRDKLWTTVIDMSVSIWCCICNVDVFWQLFLHVSGSGSSKRLAKKDAAVAMLQYISDGGEMVSSDDGNKELGRPSSEVVNTSASFDRVVY